MDVTCRHHPVIALPFRVISIIIIIIGQPAHPVFLNFGPGHESLLAWLVSLVVFFVMYTVSKW